MTNSEKTTAIKKHLGQIFILGHRLTDPLYYLQLVREKLEERNLQSFDKEDILGEFGKIQSYTNEINSEMLRIHDLLKQ